MSDHNLGSCEADGTKQRDVVVSLPPWCLTAHEGNELNHSSTNVTIQADGKLRVRTVSTQMDCDVGEDDENETDEQQA